MTEHTPGPWRVGDGGLTVFGPKTEHPAPITVANLLNPTERVPMGERRANALLIAAAPALLASLEELTRELGLRDGPCLKNCGCYIDTARAAISAAKGS